MSRSCGCDIQPACTDLSKGGCPVGGVRLQKRIMYRQRLRDLIGDKLSLTRVSPLRGREGGQETFLGS
jgi:hypothetical protein